MHLSLPKQFPLFILAASVCWSLQCLISALTQGGGGGPLFRLTCSVLLWAGRKAADKRHWRAWGALTVSQPHWVCPRSCCVRFPGLHFSGSRLLCTERSKAGCGLRALPRSKPLRFRLSGAPQRCFVPFPGLSSSGDQVLGECPLPSWAVRLITSPVPAARFPGCAAGAPRVSSGDLWL